MERASNKRLKNKLNFTQNGNSFLSYYLRITKKREERMIMLELKQDISPMCQLGPHERQAFREVS